MALRALQGPTGGGAPVGGSGTTNTIPRWTGPSTLGDSALVQSGTNAVGFGTLKTWGTNFTLNAIQLSESASLSADINTTYLAANQYWDSPGFQNRRIKANFAARYLLNGASGDHQFQIAPFGAADSGITWSTAMTILNTSGNVGIGTATPVGRADVAGTSVNQSGWGLLSVQSNDAQGADKGGSITFGGVYDASTATHWAQISGRKENGTSGQYGGYLAFATRTNGAGTNTERARIDSAGRMCIGTTTATTGRALTTVADLDVFGVRVGRGAGDDAESTALGAGALAVQTSGARYNTAIGRSALTTVAGGRFNTAVGWSALKFVTSGENNTAIGIDALGGIDTTSQNAAVGREAGRYISGGGSLTAASDSVFLGYNARANANSESNQIVIGANATGNGSNTVTIGNSSNVGTFLDTKYVRIVDSYTVATLPVAGTAGRIARVTDGDAALAWGATVVNTGAGATPYLVWDNGTNWTVFGK